MRQQMSRRRLLVVAGLVWLSRDRLLFQRRGPQASHGPGALELPGGKVELGEAPRLALERELCEEWGAGAKRCQVGGVVEVLHHIYPNPGPEVVLLVYHVDATDIAQVWEHKLKPIEGASICAFERAEIPVDQFLAADRPFIRDVARGRVAAGTERSSVYVQR